MRDNLSDVLGPDYHTLVHIDAAGGARQFVLEPGQREARVAVAAVADHAPAASGTFEHSAASSIVAFFRLGIEHIITGFDHLLFLLALILRGGRLLSLLAIVSAFTLAHSITLALAVLDVVSLPPWLVEPVIALSIVYVAAENIFSERAPSQRWAVSFGFGLVHGFGFAGALLSSNSRGGARRLASVIQSRCRSRPGDSDRNTSADSPVAAPVRLGATRGYHAVGTRSHRGARAASRAGSSHGRVTAEPPKS
jgi:hydrogenase/urease accessory protein HupE